MKISHDSLVASMEYDSQPAGESEAFTQIRATVRIYNIKTDFTYRTGVFRDSPQEAKRLKDLATSTANKWLEEIYFFISAVPEPEIIYYKPSPRCMSKTEQDVQERLNTDRDKG